MAVLSKYFPIKTGGNFMPKGNFVDILWKKVFGTPELVSTEPIKNKDLMTREDAAAFERYGVTVGDLHKMVLEATSVNYERDAFYQEIQRALPNSLIGAALELYADSSTSYSQTQNASVWVTSDSKNYVNTLTNLFDFIGIEEKIFKWAWGMAGYGDFWVEINAVPGKGIISVEDNFHPVDISRVDHNGRLIGFYKTPISGVSTSGDENKLIAPWKYVHFRILGAKVRVPNRGGVTSFDNRQISLLGTDIQRASSAYGSSVLTNALPIYKRFKLADDTLLMSRVSKSILKYLYKIKVSGNNNQAIASIINNYSAVLKRARAIDITSGSENYRNALSDLAGNEDLLVPVWDDAGNLEVEKLGGEADIQHTVDVDSLRNQLACALRVPLQLLGGFTGDLPSSLGQSSIERLDIRFAKSCHRIQRALIEGITRIAQIHLAFQGKPCDLRMFDVNMSDTSSAEEVELKEALSSGVDIVDKVSEMIMKFSDQTDPIELFNYLNQKILKLNDLDLRKMKRNITENIKGTNVSFTPRKRANTDLKSFVPGMKKIKEGKETKFVEDGGVWEEKYGNAVIKIEETK
jgi:hypothetical protein